MTIRDVARLAGVSSSTVSRVMNNSAFVTPAIKERINQVLRETGYTPNVLAKNLLHKKTNTIGILLPRIDLATFAAMFDGVTEVLDHGGYQMLLANTRDQEREELRYLRLFHEKRVDGLLYFATAISDQHRTLISRMATPTVVLGHNGRDLGTSAVRLDSYGAARAVVGHLVALGHRRIGCLAVEDHDEDIATLRKKGYRDALEAGGLPFDPALMTLGDFEYPSGERGIMRLMERRPGYKPPTAVFSITDRLAVAALGWLHRHHHRVPEDVALACVDDPELLSHTAPPLTTAGFDYHEAGARAARMLLERIEGRGSDDEEVVMPYHIRLRQSTGDHKGE